jgi:hypothetical protein
MVMASPFIELHTQVVYIYVVGDCGLGGPCKNLWLWGLKMSLLLFNMWLHWRFKLWWLRSICFLEHPSFTWHATPLSKHVVVILVFFVVALDSYMWLWLLEGFVKTFSCALSFWMLKHYHPLNPLHQTPLRFPCVNRPN